MKLRDNTILITGGGSGIGFALAQALYENNTIIVCGRNGARLAELRERLPKVITYQCNLAQSESRNRLTDYLGAEHPQLNVLINNAGVQHNQELSESVDGGDAVQMEILSNLTVPILLTTALLPGLLRQPEAAIVNVTSILFLAPKQNAPVYCASKAGLHSFPQAIRYQLENSSVRICELLPPPVDTAMTKGRGRGKVSPERVAQDTLLSLARNMPEIYIEKARLLYWLNRLSPGLVMRLLRNS